MPLKFTPEAQMGSVARKREQLNGAIQQLKWLGSTP